MLVTEIVVTFLSRNVKSLFQGDKSKNEYLTINTDSVERYRKICRLVTIIYTNVKIVKTKR